VEDLTQEALLAVADGLSSLRTATIDALKSFTSVIVARRVADFLRRFGSGPRKDVASLDSTTTGASTAGPLRDLLAASGTSPGSAVANVEQLQLVLDELGSLKPEYRDVIALAFFDQIPTAEIAERMGLSRPAASMLLIRAVKTLRRNITGSSRVGKPDAR
jgi:RNA polymerase sigma factor (sigma-70 family)